MRARCGRCGTGFEVMAPGRYACPGCGVTNEVRGSSEGPPPPGPGGSQFTVPPPPPPDIPSQRARCQDEECGFSFIVGDVQTAPCPMCGIDVPVGTGP
ncbi:MAG: hypothetical protein OXH10_03520 [bacterium]|nr:hypothetical protein [bacterium]MCY3580247.1 hypothetical protein [bacterium]MCY3653285.1 hypothetical protein [bacterium]MDE0642841.1 hypothetical protein [bacterium]MYD03992.1 hypothetical protein [Acidimicrobiia bacterium]